MFLLAITFCEIQSGCRVNVEAQKEAQFQAEIEDNVNNRINYFIGLYGSKEKLEKASGKGIEQLKDDMRESIISEIKLRDAHLRVVIDTPYTNPP